MRAATVSTNHGFGDACWRCGSLHAGLRHLSLFTMKRNANNNASRQLSPLVVFFALPLQLCRGLVTMSAHPTANALSVRKTMLPSNSIFFSMSKGHFVYSVLHIDCSSINRCIWKTCGRSRRTRLCCKCKPRASPHQPHFSSAWQSPNPRVVFLDRGFQAPTRQIINELHTYIPLTRHASRMVSRHVSQQNFKPNYPFVTLKSNRDSGATRNHGERRVPPSRVVCQDGTVSTCRQRMSTLLPRQTECSQW